MNIRLVRRICQAFFALLFLWFCLVATVGTQWWQLRGWPVNWFLELDPLVALATLLTTGTVYAGLLWALVTIALTIVLGRFFCSWVCPFGSLHHLVGWLGRRTLRFTERVSANQYRQGQAIKYYLLIFLLAAAAGHILGGLLQAGRDHPALPWLLLALALLVVGTLAARRVVAGWRRAAALCLGLAAAWSLAALFLPGAPALAASLQTGLLDPIPLLQRSVNLAVLPFVSRAPRWYDGAWLIGAIFLGAVALNLLVPRFYCRFLCPLGALLGVLGRWAVWRVGKVSGECSGCELCEDNCEGACDPFGRIRTSECLLCLNCLDACRQARMSYRTEPSAAGEFPSPDVSRRGFLVAAAAGLAAPPLLRLGGLTGPNWRPAVIRPPGALAEEEFLERCIKCGQCMRVCPTNIIQPAGLQAGLEGLWTPLLNYRIGTSGCQLHCIACGQLCPTAAIRPLSLEEKLGRGPFAARGPIRLGTAFVDRGRCLPWAMEKPCIVCQENCPVSPKAIYLREEFVVLRDGTCGVLSVHDESVQLDRATLAPGRLATGDFYCRPAGPAGERRRIVGNSADTLTLAPAAAESHVAPGDRVHLEVRLQRPYVDPHLCIGCGVCEHECPVSGQRAIRVTAENETRHRRHALTTA